VQICQKNPVNEPEHGFNGRSIKKTKEGRSGKNLPSKTSKFILLLVFASVCRVSACLEASDPSRHLNARRSFQEGFHDRGAATKQLARPCAPCYSHFNAFTTV
jgi:hypothetical protein